MGIQIHSTILQIHGSDQMFFLFYLIIDPFIYLSRFIDHSTMIGLKYSRDAQWEDNKMWYSVHFKMTFLFISLLIMLEGWEYHGFVFWNIIKRL